MSSDTDMCMLWAEQIKQAAQILANATIDEIASLNSTALCDLDYLMVDASEAIKYWRGEERH